MTRAIFFCGAFISSTSANLGKYPTNRETPKLEVIDQILVGQSLFGNDMRDMGSPLSSPLCTIFSGPLDTKSSGRSNIVVRYEDWGGC